MLSSQRDAGPYPTLTGWIALDYFRRLRPLRGQRIWVTLAAVAVSAAYAGWSLLPAHHAAHEAAPVATAHAMFNDDCSKCHSVSLQPLVRLARGDLVRSVTDRTCLSCHDGAVHHTEQHAAPACATCHSEHRGKPILARVADAHCTACHAELKKSHPQTTYGDVTSFNLDHPEFEVLRTGRKDVSKLDFNHARHLRLDLQALRAIKDSPRLEAFGDRLDCVNCHQPDAERRYMQPISYQKHCAACHSLTVRINGELPDSQTRAAAETFRHAPAPHQEPRIVRAVLRERLLEWVQANPVVLGSELPPPRPLPGRGPRPISAAQERWVKGQLDLAQQLLFVDRQLPNTERGVFEGSCRQCHIEARPQRGADELPEYLPTAIPERWFKHSSFQHDSHRSLECLSCHAGATASSKSSDVLLPSLESCRKCHQPGLARNDCAECHAYHHRAKERSMNGPFTIDKLLGSH
jgi:hypothetical protein